MTQQLQAVENNPAPYSMAKIYEAYGMYDEAIAVYEHAAELNPDSSVLEQLTNLYIALGWKYLVNGQPEKLIETIESVSHPEVREELMLLLANHHLQSQKIRRNIIELLYDSAQKATDAENKALRMAVLIYYLHQVGENEKIAQLAPGSFVREAESADTITGLFQIEKDENTSGGQSVWTPEGVTVHEETSTVSGDVIYNMNLPEAGVYKIIARVFAQPGSDTFYLKFDDSQFYRIWDLIPGLTWNWQVLTARPGRQAYLNQPIHFPLSASEHQFKLKPREEGTRLDALVFYRMDVSAEVMSQTTEAEGTFIHKMLHKIMLHKMLQQAQEHRERGELKAAVEAYKKAMDRATEPWELVQVYVQLGKSYLASGQPEKVKGLIESAFNADVQSQLMMLLAKDYAQRGQMGEIIPLLSDAAKNSPDPEHKSLYMGMSIYYLHQAGETDRITQLAPGSFVREAESADTIPDMFQVEVDENASGGQFLWRPEGATSGSGNALYNFTIPEAGIYKIIARTFATDGESDSFYVKFDDSKRYYTWYTAIWSEWNWEVLMGRRTDRAGADSYINRPIRFPLSVGEHQFQLRAREDGTRLDVLVFYREETMTQQLQAVENNPDAPYSMAKIYKAYGMYDEAITAYERAAELSPDEKHILEPLAKLYADSDLPGWQARALKAKAIYKHLIGLAQTSYDRTRYRRQLLDLHKQLGEIDAAVTMLRDAVRSEPELLEGGAALRGIWKLYTAAGRSSEGVKMLEVLASQMEESSLLHEVLGDIYKQMGDSAKAKAAYTKSFQLRQQEANSDGNVQSKAQYMGELIYHLHRVGERDKIAQLAPGSFVREAESADVITGMFQIETDENGKFVWAPKGTSSYWQAPTDSGDVIFDLNIPEKGKYQIIARVFAESGSNSFFVNFGDSEYYRRWEISNMSKWNWQALTIYPSDQAARFSLSAGEHKLKLKVREDGTRLDALVFYRL